MASTSVPRQITESEYWSTPRRNYKRAYKVPTPLTEYNTCGCYEFPHKFSNVGCLLIVKEYHEEEAVEIELAQSSYFNNTIIFEDRKEHHSNKVTIKYHLCADNCFAKRNINYCPEFKVGWKGLPWSSQF